MFLHEAQMNGVAACDQLPNICDQVIASQRKTPGHFCPGVDLEPAVWISAC